VKPARSLRPAEPPRAAVWSGTGVRRTSNRNAASCAPWSGRSLSALGWTVLNTGPRTGSTTATTTFKRLGVSNTIPSRLGPAPATLTRSPIAVDSTTPSLPVARRVRFAAGRSPGRYGERIDAGRHRSQTARQLARAVDDGRNVGAALRHLASRRLASRPSGCRRLGGRRALGEMRATRGTARRAGSHQSVWRSRAHAARPRSTHRRSAAGGGDRRPRRSVRSPQRPRVTVRNGDS
jgi:hypothetical protein